MPLLVVLLLGILTSCGAGVGVAAILSKNGSRRPPPEVRPPELSLPEPTGPLVPPIDVIPVRTVVISDYQVQSSSQLRVELRALDVVSVQSSPLILSSASGASVLGFILQSREINAKVSDLTAADVDARLAVLVDDVEIAPPVPFLLRKQPRASLVPPQGQTVAFLSVLGGTRLTVRSNYLIGATPDDVQIQIGAIDPNGAIRLQKCSDLEVATAESDGAVVVSGIAPSVPFAGSVLVAIVDSKAGSSTLVPNVFYKAALDVVSPRTAATEGGEVVTLAGTAMVPFDRSQNPATLDFSKVSVLLRRGGREVVVPAVSMRPDLSSPSRLVFTVPPSPDGRAGPADVVLRMEFSGGVAAETIAPALFVYGYSTPLFGPRGTVLPDAPTRIALAPIEGFTSDSDLAMLSSLGGLPRVFLFAARGNGMFTRLGAPFEGGLLADPNQRLPSDLLTTDLDGDGRMDLFVLNQGSTQGANHGLLLNRPKPAAPLVFVGGVLSTQPGPRRVVRGDLDEDGIVDLVMLPTPQAFLAKFASGPSGGLPSFVSVTIPGVGAGPYDAVEVADLDGDRHLDVAFVVGGVAPRVAIAFGDGHGAFVSGPVFALAIPGYTGVASSPAVGLHACGTGPLRSLAVVLAGRGSDAATQPTVAVLAQPTARAFAQPIASGVWSVVDADEALATSTLADLDGDGIGELVVGHVGVAKNPLHLLTWVVDHFVERPDSVERGIEDVRDVRQIIVEGNAAKIAHTVLVDGSDEFRVSTWLVAAGPRLVAPDAARGLPSPIKGIAIGDFRANGNGTRDAIVASGSALDLLVNDGIGTFTSSTRIDVPHLVPRTLQAVRLAQPTSAGGDGLVFLLDDGRIGWLPPGATTPLLGVADLRRFGPSSIWARPVGESSQLAAADVDADGISDLVVLLSCDAVGSERREGEALLFVLRGRSVTSSTELPLREPPPGLAVARLHGNATGLALGAFVHDPSAPSRLEAAVAIPSGDSGAPAAGNHIRFFRYAPGATPAEDRFVPSFAEDGKAVLIAGDQPEQIVASDFDGNGTIDLAVASAGDARMRVLLNSGSKLATHPLEVNIGAFVESFGVPPPLPPGRPRAVFLADLNGDGIADLLVASTDDTGVLRTGIGIYLSNGNGRLALTTIVPPVRTGDLVPAITGGFVPRNANSAFALGDVNGDGTLDLLVGWATTGSTDRNLRVLFGGAR